MGHKLKMKETLKRLHKIYSIRFILIVVLDLDTHTETNIFWFSFNFLKLEVLV